MKYNIVALIIALGISFIACDKSILENAEETQERCQYVVAENCDDREFHYPDFVDDSYTKQYVENVVTSADCNCIVRGQVRYILDGKIVAHVKYGSGDCDNFGIRILCVDGNCSHPEAVVCRFEMDCSSN